MACKLSNKLKRWDILCLTVWQLPHSAVKSRWADTCINPILLPDECAGGWQATEKSVFLLDECASGWRTAEKSVVEGKHVTLRCFCFPLKFGYHFTGKTSHRGFVPRWLVFFTLFSGDYQ